ncbi:hypothetical protein D3C87_2168490 [compost metagenome]
MLGRGFDRGEFFQQSGSLVVCCNQCPCGIARPTKGSSIIQPSEDDVAVEQVVGEKDHR